MHQTSLHPGKVSLFRPDLPPCPSPRSLLTPADPVDGKHWSGWSVSGVACANLPEEEGGCCLFPGRECPEPLGTQTPVTMSLMSSPPPSPAHHFLSSREPASLLLLSSAKEDPKDSSPSLCKTGQHLPVDGFLISTFTLAPAF